MPALLKYIKYTLDQGIEMKWIDAIKILAHREYAKSTILMRQKMIGIGSLLL